MQSTDTSGVSIFNGPWGYALAAGGALIAEFGSDIWTGIKDLFGGGGGGSVSRPSQGLGSEIIKHLPAAETYIDNTFFFGNAAAAGNAWGEIDSGHGSYFKAIGLTTTLTAQVVGQAYLAVDGGGELLGESAVQKYEWHHLLPQQFAEEFAEVGLDVDDFTIKLEKGFHQNYVHGQPLNGKGGSWNIWWESFFYNNENPTEASVLSYMNAMMKAYGISGKIVRYPFAGLF